MSDSGAERRGRTRDRALIRTLGAGAGLQVATVGGAILSLPFVTRSLTSSEYGVVATVTGFVALLGFADLGVGAALTSRLAEASGRDDDTGTESLISNAVAAATIAAGGVLIIGLIMTIVTPWQRLLGAPTLAPGVLRLCVLCLVVSTAVSIVGSLGQRALYGIQRGNVANHWLAAATAGGAAASIAVSVVDGPLYAYVLAIVGTPALVSVACTVWTLKFTQLRVRPRLRHVSRRTLLDLAGTSSWFFVITVAGAVGYQTDALVVSAVLGSSAAGVYSVAWRVFGLLTQTMTPALLQLWPAFAEALGRGDIRWIRTRFVWSTVLVTVIGVVVGLALVVAGPALVTVWLTDELAPSRSLLLCFAAWSTFLLALGPLFYLINAIGRARANALMAVTVALVNLPLSIGLTHAIGLGGPVIGSLISGALFAGVPSALIARHLFRDGARFAKPEDPDLALPQPLSPP